MAEPRITVAIAFHDEEAYLAAAVRSVLAQTVADFELLLLDDGSTDRSLDVAHTFAGDPRVRVLSDGRRRHLGARLNQALSLAKGELFARMDADDIAHPARLALQVAHLDRESRCDAVGTWAALIDRDEQPFAVIEAARAPATGRQILSRGVIPHATMVARTAWLRQYPYDEELARAEDRDLWCRAAPGSRIDAVEDVLYVIRVVPRADLFLADYLRGQADLRRVTMRHGAALVGRWTTAKLVSSSLLKSAAMVAAHGLGVSDRLVHRRGREPTAVESARVEEALRVSR